jgi:antitoxin (DNA-binding transcriptional repressor) of toxin-antitoxin stability system
LAQLNSTGFKGILFRVKTATIEELRADPDCLERWISAGEEVRIVKNGTPFANVLPFRVAEEAAEVRREPIEMPDFMARMKRIWGDRVFTEEEEQDMRDYEDGLID